MRLSDPADAEDAAIRVMTNAFAALPNFVGGTGQFRSWLFAIAHNEVVNVYRAHARRPTSPMPDEFDLVDPHPTPEQLALSSDEQRNLWQLLQGLPQRSREVVELRLSGFTSQEIAAILGISDGAVRQAQSRALDQLRQIVIDDNTALGGAACLIISVTPSMMTRSMAYWDALVRGQQPSVPLPPDVIQALRRLSSIDPAPQSSTVRERAWAETWKRMQPKQSKEEERIHPCRANLFEPSPATVHTLATPARKRPSLRHRPGASTVSGLSSRH